MMIDTKTALELERLELDRLRDEIQKESNHLMEYLTFVLQYLPVVIAIVAIIITIPVSTWLKNITLGLFIMASIMLIKLGESKLKMHEKKKE